MRALAGDVDVEEGASRHHRTGTHREFSQSQAGPVVHSEYRVAGEALEETVRDHGLCAPLPLLGGLKDEMHRSVEAPGLGEVARGGEQHRGMAVVAAGMHLPGVRRAMLEVIGLVYGQRVHVSPQPDLPRSTSGAQHPDHARASDPGVHFAAKLSELLRDDAGRAAFLEPKLRMRVDVAAPARQLILGDCDRFEQVHGYPVSFVGNRRSKAMLRPRPLFKQARLLRQIEAQTA